jgi:superfamily II DNA or RNA helicase
MTTPKTLDELARWAREEGLGRFLAQPLHVVFEEVGLLEGDESLLHALCERLHARSLSQALRNPQAPEVLARMVPRERASALIHNLSSALRDFAENEDDFEYDEFSDLDEPAPSPPSVERDAPRLPPVPHEIEALRKWAAEHGVLERLADPPTVLVPSLYGGNAYLGTLVMDGLKQVEDAFKPPPPSRRTSRWEAQARLQSFGILTGAATQYLYNAATARAAVLARRAALDLRATPPSEPSLLALVSKLEALRAELAPRVKPRAIGTYPAQPARVEEAPLRIVYVEGAGGIHSIRVSIAVEEEPLRAVCSCPEGRSGPCPHALSAVDAALDLLRDPQGERGKLAAILAIPPWQRFLSAFNHEITRRQAPAAPEDVRLAWRIAGSGAVVTIEPVLQKRLKSGGWSQGSRARIDDLLERRGLLADPRDARAVEVLSTVLEELGSISRSPLSRSRNSRVVEALIGHPRVFLEGRAGSPARVTRERLRVALEPSDSGVLVSFFIGASRYDAADLLDLVHGDDPVIAVDVSAGSVALCALDERAKALLSAFAKHPARFPPESHDELVRGLAPLQDSVDLALPEALAGEPIEGDARPVVRLSPNDAGDVDVDVLVRPIEGGPVFRPGEGPDVVLHAFEGRRVKAERDLAREASFAAAVVAHLPPGHGAPTVDQDHDASRWSFHLDEEAALDLLAALRDLGEAAVVEWPEPEKRLSLASMVSRKELRIRVLDRRDWFGVEGEVEVDGDTLPLTALLDAVRRGRRYVRVGPGRFAEIADDLRKRVAAADDVLHPGRRGLEVSLPGVALLEDLVDGAGHLEAASRWRELVARLDAARALDPALPEGFSATLRPYQMEGFKWLARLAAWGAGACLADDMGLGKTVQALALLLSRAPQGPALVIAPTSVGPNWLRETERFAPGLRARLYRGPGRSAILAEAGPGDLLVTSYALAVRDAEALGQVRFGTLVLDEAQAIKNALTRRARAIGGLSAELRIALTGTPVENHLGELWSLMRVLTPGLLGSWDHFRDRFATPIERGRDPARSAALSRLVRPFLLRRTKAEVAPELPPRTEIERFVDLSPAERRLYDEARRAALEEIATGGGDKRFALFAALTRLRLLSCHPRLYDDASTIPSSKLSALLETVEELRDEGHRALVFSQFTSHLGLVREALDRRKITYEYLDGRTPSEERTRRIDAFQGGRSDLFLISLKAGGTGLNLTGADYVIHLDPWWNPAVEDQATDRAHRIGQTKAVTVIRLVSRGTIEEAVLALHKDKRALAASVFDEEGSPARLSPEELAALIRAGADETSGDDEGDSAGDEVVPSSDRAPKTEHAGPRRGLRPNTSGTKIPEAGAEASPLVPASETQASPPAPVPPSVSPVPPVPTEALVTRLIDHLAVQRGGVDPRYDPTLRTYSRSLRRFSEYLTKNGGADEPTEAVIAEYLEAVNQGRWPAPASERGIARTVMNHLKAFLREGAGEGGRTPQPPSPSRAVRGV